MPSPTGIELRRSSSGWKVSMRTYYPRTWTSSCGGNVMKYRFHSSGKSVSRYCSQVPRLGFHVAPSGGPHLRQSLLLCSQPVFSKTTNFWKSVKHCIVYCSADYRLNAWCVWQSPPARWIYVVCWLAPWFFLLFWAQCTHAQVNPFYHPFNPDVT